MKKRRALACLCLFLLAACASQPRRPATPGHTAADDATPTVASPQNAVEAVAPLTGADRQYVPVVKARQQFVADTAQRFALDPAYVDATLQQAQRLDEVVALMSKPAERVKPWYEYRARMVTDARVNQGRAFFAAHRDALLRASDQYGVAPEVITAILGVETNYGAFTGKIRVLDALYTLGFFYPRSGDPAKLDYEIRRERFFRDELAQLFALCREDRLDILALNGSYAGAMGMGQFMPSSYRQLAVDGDGDGRRDLFADADDAIFSVANYFAKKGGANGSWVRGAPVAVRATLLPGFGEFNPDEWLPTYSLADLRQRGYVVLGDVPAGTTATPISLDGEAGKEYWLGFRNYYAITRYNHSKMYAMAVYELSQAIAASTQPMPAPNFPLPATPVSNAAPAQGAVAPATPASSVPPVAPAPVAPLAAPASATPAVPTSVAAPQR